MSTFAVLLGVAFQCYGQVNVLTRNYNNQRTGANLLETTLNTSNVNTNQFGKLFALPVDDQVYASVLYVSSLQIAGGTHNVIFAATTNNSVYAFDADAFGPPLWFRNFNGTGRPLTNADVGNAGHYNDYRGTIGIVGTPVIDGVKGTMYFLTRTMENNAVVQRLRAVDITTGADRTNSPQVIQASVLVNGNTIGFNPATQNHRPALLLSQGVVYLAWASYGDVQPYYGWVLAYDATSLALVGAFNDAPNGSMGGIWMAGAGPAVDASGNLYVATGNGSFDGVTGFGESLVKLSPSSLGVIDYFAPSSYNSLNAGDLDFGSAGPTMIPGTNLVVQGGKTGIIYLLNTSNLGHEVSGDTQVQQFFQAVDTTIRPTATHHIHNASPVWNSPAGLNLYVWGENDFIHIYRFNTSTQKFNTPPAFNGSVLPPTGMPGGMMTISANGSQSGSGVVWAAAPRYGDANLLTVPGNLYAYNAENLSLLWSSVAAGDDLLSFSKGSAPIVANGKVYLGSTSKFVNVYGLKSSGVTAGDIAVNQATTSSTPCNSSQTAAQAVNGSFSGGANDKWCSAAANPWMVVDLGATFNLNRFVVEHAGSGGEAFNLNTSAFNIQVSTDSVNYTTVANVTGNIDSITTHDIAPTAARFVRLNIVTPTQSGDTSARIYEFQIFASQAGVSEDFSVSVGPSSQTLIAGLAANLTATTIALGGFNGPVTWSATGLPAGAVATFNPTTVNGSGSSALSISTSSSTTPGTYTPTITGTSGGLQHSQTVTMIVTQGGAVNLSTVYNRTGIYTDGTVFSSTSGFDLNGNAYSGNLLGTSVVYQGLTFGLGPANAKNVVANATIPLPPGPLVSLGVLASGVNGNQTNQTFRVNYTDGTSSVFTQSVSDWHNPQSYAGESRAVTMAYRNLSNGTKDNRTFYVYAYTFSLAAKTVSSITLPNNNNVVVLAISTTTSSGGAADFSLAASPGSQTVAPGSGTSYTTTLTTLNGFSGSVALTSSGLPSGAAATFNPTSLTGSGTTSTMSITTQSTTPAGSYTITITGTSGSLQHTATATLVVSGSIGTGVPVNLSSVYNRSGMYTDGTPIPSTGGLDQNGNAYSATLLGSSVTFQGLPFNLGPSNAPDAVANATIPLPAGQYNTLTLLATGVNGNKTNQTFTVNYTDGTTSVFTQSLSDWHNPQSYVGETQAVTMPYRNLSDGSKDNRTFYLYGYTFALAAKNVASITLPANGSVVVLSATLATSGPGPDFSLAASPGSQTVAAGAGTSYTTTLTTLNGFSGSVALTSSGLPSGAAATFNPTAVTGSGSTSTLSITTQSTTPAGTYTITITGTSGSLQHTATATLVVTDFSLAASPGSQTVPVGAGTSYTTTLTTLNGFSGSVALTSSGLPSGAAATFNPTSVTGSGSTSTLSITTQSTTPAGTYTITITGTSGGLQHTATATLVVTNFSLSASPGSQTVAPGSATSYTTTLTTQSGFSGSVALTSSGLPSGAAATFNPTSLTGSGSSSTVSVTTQSTTPAGTYTITFTGTSGGLQRTATATLVVSGSSSTVVPVDLSSVYNRSGMYTDGTAIPSTGGLDQNGNAYSATLLGSSVTFQGLPFNLGPSNAPDAVANATIPLPAGQYNTLTLLAAGVNGSKGNQTFTVNYTDGTTSVFTQSLSDWFAPQGYAGETQAVIMPYRNLSNGTKDNRTFYLYGYSFVLAAKNVASFTLPANGTVVVLGVTLATSGPVPDFSLAASPGSQTVLAGGGTSYTATLTKLNGFSGSVALTSSGLPNGAAASFNPASLDTSQSTSTVNITTQSTTPVGSYTITIKGTSGSLQHTATATLVVTPASSTGVKADLSSVYNRSGMYTDGTSIPSSGGLDLNGNAFSANLLGSSATFQGLSFNFGPSNAPDAAANTTIPLPAGQYSTLTLLGTAVNGNKGNQAFTVKYTDGTTSVFTQSLSDWFAPQGYAGENQAVVMPYRNLSNGSKDNRTFYLYGYSFALAAKNVASITLPANGSVLVLAITLAP